MAPRQKVYTLEEFMQDGGEDTDSGVLPLLAELFEDVKNAHAEDDSRSVGIIANLYTKPEYQTGYKSVWTRNFRATDDPRVIYDNLLAELNNSPGDNFCGALSLRFHVPWQKQALRTYERTMSRSFLAVDPVTERAGVLPDQSSVYAQYIKPHADMTLRFAEQMIGMAKETAAALQAASSVIMAQKPAPLPSTGSPLLDVGRQMLQLAGSDAAHKTAAAPQGQAPAPPPQTAAPLPPSPIPWGTAGHATPLSVSAPPQIAGPAPGNVADLDPTDLTEAQLDVWAKAHPDRARAYVIGKLRESGVPV